MDVIVKLERCGLTSGPPKVTEPFLPNPASVPAFVEHSFDAWQQGPKWAKTIAVAFEAGVGELTKRRFCVGAYLYNAASFLQKHAAVGCADTQFGALKSSDVQLPSSLATALSQFGELQAAANGRRYEVPDVDSFASHLVRSALLYNSPALVPDDQVGLISANWWMPVRPNDAVTDLFIALSLHRHVRNRLVAPAPYLNVRDWRPFSGAVPPWWALALPDDDDRVALAWLNEARPANIALWFANRAAPNVQTRYQSLALIDIPVNNAWNEVRTSPTQNYKFAATELLTYWNTYRPTMERLFNLSSSQLTRDSAGSPAQLGFLREDQPNALFLLRHELEVDASQASLFVAYPATSLYFEGQPPAVRHHANSAMVRLERQKFAAADLKA
jgi:hypothetical protein